MRLPRRVRHSRGVNSRTVRVLLVGSGGREHALAWKLAQSPSLDELHAAPGNPGIAQLGSCHPVRAEDGDGLLGLAGTFGTELVVIGPEAPLVAGVADELRHAGSRSSAPAREAARIEGSKSFAKDVMAAAGVPAARDALRSRARRAWSRPTGSPRARASSCAGPPRRSTPASAQAAALGGTIVIEELLEGQEVSLFALFAGAHVDAAGRRAGLQARRRRRHRARTRAAWARSRPVPGAERRRSSSSASTSRSSTELARRGTPFVGVLFAGLMLTADGPGCSSSTPLRRSRDTGVLPRLEGDLLEASPPPRAASATASHVADEPEPP